MECLILFLDFFPKREPEDESQREKEYNANDH